MESIFLLCCHATAETRRLTKEHDPKLFFKSTALFVLLIFLPNIGPEKCVSFTVIVIRFGQETKKGSRKSKQARNIRRVTMRMD